VIVAFDFPSPFSLMGGLGGLLSAGADMVLGAGQDIVLDGFTKLVGWLVESVLSALVELAVALLAFFWDASEPNVGASWFSGGESTPYGQMVMLALPLLLAFFLAGVIQGILKGDPAGMVRMAFVRLPGAALAMTVTVAFTDLLLAVTDDMSALVLGGFRDDIDATTEMIGTVASMTGLTGGAMLLVLLFGAVGLLAAVVVILELFVRAGLIYLVVALCPFIYAAAVWESMRNGVRRMAEIGFALIMSKFVIAVALALSASAMTSMWQGTDTELATPEQAVQASEAGAAQMIGILLSSIVMFAVAAFMPFVLYKLLPVAEAAAVGHGIKSGPLRTAQQGHHLGMMARHNPATRAVRRHRPVRNPGDAGTPADGAPGGGAWAGPARGRAPAGAGKAAAGSGAGAGGSSGGGAAGAAAGPAGVAVAAAAAGASAAKAGARRVQSSASTMSTPPGPSSTNHASTAPRSSRDSGVGPARGANQRKWRLVPNQPD
jgi:type IV secretion system protein TrbL